MSVVYILIGLLMGALLSWLYLRAGHSTKVAESEGRAKTAEALASEAQRREAELKAELTAERAELDAERRAKADASARLEILEDIEGRLRESFKSLSSDALAQNSERLTAIAGQRLDGKKELIDQSLDAMSKTLSEMQKKISDVEKGNVEVSSLIKHHSDVTSKLKDTADHLRHALASSKKRGEWGERMAEDVIRLVGMVEGINYLKQKTLEDSTGRPDYTFLLPNNLRINMDVKFPLDSYQNYLEAGSEHERKRYKEELLKATRLMIRDVTGRSYIDPSGSTVDYVIVFIPNEQVYGFINESDPRIMDESLSQKVILCSPFTLYAVLAVVRQAVESFNLERTASEILKLLAEFNKQWNKYKDTSKAMGERLDAAKKEYDTLTTTRTNMLERPLKKIDDLARQKAITIDSEDPPLL